MQYYSRVTEKFYPNKGLAKIDERKKERKYTNEKEAKLAEKWGAKLTNLK